MTDTLSYLAARAASAHKDHECEVLEAVVPMERWITDELPMKPLEPCGGFLHLPELRCEPYVSSKSAAQEDGANVEKWLREASYSLNCLQRQQVSHEARIEHMLVTHQQAVMKAISLTMNPQAQGRIAHAAAAAGVQFQKDAQKLPSNAPESGQSQSPAPAAKLPSNAPGSGRSQSSAPAAEVPEGTMAVKPRPVRTQTSLELYGSLVEATHSFMRRQNKGEGAECPHTQGFRKRVKALVGSRFFDLAIAGSIFLNAVFVGVQAEWEAQNPSNPDPAALQVCRIVITGGFTLELFLRFVADRCFLLSPRNSYILWNMFDVTLVTLALLDEVMVLMAAENLNTSTVRLLRICRLVRALRIIRVMRFFRDLRFMVVGIISSLKSLLWAIVLLILVMYVFAVLFVQVACEERLALEAGAHNLNLSPEVVMDLVKHFGTMPRAISTLFMSMCGGLDWGVAADPLGAASPLFAVLFAAYISIIVFCVLNIVTGVFVENATKITVVDKEEQFIEELHERRRWMEEVKALFTISDSDSDGQLANCVDWKTFESCFSDIRVQACLGKMGLDTVSMCPRSLFELLDIGGNERIDIDEFAAGLQQFRGTALRVDLARLMHSTMSLTRKLNDVEASLQCLCQPVQKDHTYETVQR